MAVARGMKISLGHTNAPSDILREAIRLGATAFTHLGNGCPRELDRHDNILWRVFETTSCRSRRKEAVIKIRNPKSEIRNECTLMVSLIPDQIHVSPPLFRLIHRVLDSESLSYTTE